MRTEPTRTPAAFPQTYSRKKFFRSNIIGLILIVSTATIFSARNDAAAASKSMDGVLHALYKQNEAWNTGDLETFLHGYKESEDITFVSGATELRGFKALRERYEKKYGNSKETMGKLAFSQLEVSDLGKDYALCVGHWKVERKYKPDLTGMFSLVLVREGKDWKIIHDHTSGPEVQSSN